jgi:L-ascorbate metabolism protein UlaG (beta-lactamase superfamily)
MLLKKFMFALIFILFVILILGIYISSLPQFGASPAFSRLHRIQLSPNYENGSFQNLTKTEVMNPESSWLELIKSYINPPKNRNADTIPNIKTDLKMLGDTAIQVIWFGHSSYLLKLNNTHVLVDPVFSGYASPFSFMVKSYPGANQYGVNDLPFIDAVLITHDHYDHLDYLTIQALQGKVKHFYVPLGVGAHLEHWGVDAGDITELDWWDSLSFEEVKLTCTPARHFSGRLFKRGNTLWASYVLQFHGKNIYIGGDSGYDKHFKQIAEYFGAMDISFLECGQYNKNWPSIHMSPEETVQAAVDLKSTFVVPVHNSKFTLALHSWNEPLLRVKAAANNMPVKLVTPLIGEVVQFELERENIVWWDQVN